MQQAKAMKLKPQPRHEGQALVELALSITFIALLLAAVVDLGLAFKTQQMLINATAEATSYLSQQPLIHCGTTCTVDQLKSGADTVALRNFRQEIGATMRGGVSQLLDLNADGKDDVTQNGWSEATFRSGNWFRIDPADSSQFNPSNPAAFKISTFTPSAHQACIERQRTYSGGQCYIVVRAQITYRPFFALARAMGSQITIRAYAIKPIVGGSRHLP